MGSENTFKACIYLAGTDSNIFYDLSPHHLDLRPIGPLNATFWLTC